MFETMFGRQFVKTSDFMEMSCVANYSYICYLDVRVCEEEYIRASSPAHFISIEDIGHHHVFIFCDSSCAHSSHCYLWWSKCVR